MLGFAGLFVLLVCVIPMALDTLAEWAFAALPFVLIGALLLLPAVWPYLLAIIAIRAALSMLRGMCRFFFG